MLDYDALFSGDDMNAFDAFAPPPTPKPQARANALRTKPTRTSTSVSPNVGSDVPVTAPQPQPMNAAQTRSTLGQQAVRDIELAEKEIERYTGPQDYTAMQDYAKQRTQKGQHSLLLALAAQTAGKEFEPIGGAYLKQAMEARTPLKTATGIIDDMGQHIEDPQAKAEQRIKLAQGRMAKAQQILQSNATAEEKAAAQEEALALRREMHEANLEMRRAMMAVAQSNRDARGADRDSAQAQKIGGAAYDDFMRNTKDQQTQVNAYKNLQATAQRADAASDLSFIFQYMKMLDPGSVVRESEYATAQNARGVPDTIRNLHNQILQGRRLTPTQREQFLGTAGNLAAEAEQRMGQVRSDIARQLEANRVDPSVYLPGYAPPAAAAGPAPGAVRVKGAPAPAAAPASSDAPPPGAVRVKGAR